MNRQRKIHFNSVLDIMVYTGEGVPISARLRIGRVVNAAMLVVGFGLLTFTGTLLFFREFDINRGLQERLVQMESLKKLPAVAAKVEAPAVATAHPTAAPTPAPAAAPVTAAAPASSTRDILSQNKGSTNINEVLVECTSSNCNVKLALASNGRAMAQGSLLLVLETEVPRIGASGPNAQVRKRYFLYPGNDARDELDLSALSTLPHKPFKFSTFLQTGAQFEFGKLLRPLALNIYIFDRDNSLLQHIRRPIEND